MAQAGQMAQATFAEPEHRVLISASHPVLAVPDHTLGCQKRPVGYRPNCRRALVKSLRSLNAGLRDARWGVP